ncbi:hypothetical protein HKK55_13115 [Pseudomonas sp. ADAK18]|uniref:hypothetical protein n=1 Tax=Pseudomonas sp. ADAK18 TaxID=2730848 RepID=UPI0014640F9B|nr:hypothetical protein [Pseudomonas sp. ADAK18]QJI29620.1 hypothetical protein HKK55_13115 [Pseudomonas sp. ADAK18]
MRKAPSLDNVLHYRNDALMLAFSKNNKVSMRESSELFLDLKRWIWLIGTRPSESPPFPSFPEQWIIDNYWHEFILSTREYTNFCTDFFGNYIHHTPTPNGLQGASPRLAAEDLPEFIETNKKTLEDAITEVRIKLGIKTAIRWYRELPKQYPVPDRPEYN